MAKKYFSKALSVGLSLTLCAGMIAPAFAASFSELNEAINSNEDRTFGENNDITASTGDDGVRNVTLNGDVTNSGNEDSIKIENGKEVNLDLNGHVIDNDGKHGNKSSQGQSTIWIENGKLTVNDTSDGKTGTITGGDRGGVWVGGWENSDTNKAEFVMNGGTITDNTNVNGGGTAGGGGVRVTGEHSKFTMTGGVITDNSANANGGGVAVVNGASFEMTGGELSENKSNWGGGVAVIGQNSELKMSGTALLKDNTVKENQTAGWGNNLPSDVFVKDGGKVTAEGDILTPVPDSQEFDGFKQHGKDKDGSDETWNSVSDTTLVTEITTSAGQELFLKSVYSQVSPTADGGDTGVTIEDPAVPLAAGPVTRAEFIDYLWRHEGEPESDGVCTFTDVAEDHDYVLALAWAEQNGIAEAYLNAEGHEDGTFEPDELVTVGAVREFLGNFETVFGANAVAVADLTTLAGEDDEAVLNCDEVLAEFFGEEYVPAEDKELDIAA